MEMQQPEDTDVMEASVIEERSHEQEIVYSLISAGLETVHGNFSEGPELLADTTMEVCCISFLSSDFLTNSLPFRTALVTEKAKLESLINVMWPRLKNYDIMLSSVLIMVRSHQRIKQLIWIVDL